MRAPLASSSCVRSTPGLLLGLALMLSTPAAVAQDASSPSPRPLVMAEPDPAERLPPARAAAPTSPPPTPAPPPRPRRWYGWQALVVHGVSDTILTASIAVAGASEDAAGALLVTAGLGRPLGSFVVEAVHDGEYLLAPAGSFLLPAAGGGGGIAVAEALGVGEDRVAVLRFAAGGMILGGSIMAALEAGLAFEDAPVHATLGPDGVSLTGRF